MHKNNDNTNYLDSYISYSKTVVTFLRWIFSANIFYTNLKMSDEYLHELCIDLDSYKLDVHVIYKYQNRFHWLMLTSNNATIKKNK